MARTYSYDSEATLDGGKKGFIVGALSGAALFGLITLVLDMLEIGTGGAVLAAMGGAAVGGLAGTLWGALSARHQVRPDRGYAGPERRVMNDGWPGRDRRAVRQ
jgi:hypothetical protein